MKTRFFSIALVLLLSFGMVGCAFEPPISYAEQEQMQAEISRLEEYITELQASITELQTALTALNGDVTALKTELADMQAADAATEAALTTLRTDVTFLVQEDARLQAQLIALQALVEEELQKDAAEDGESYATLAQHQALQAQVQQLQADVQDYRTLLGTYQGQQDVLSFRITLLEAATEEECRLSLGDPLQASDLAYIGCRLPVGTLSVRVETSGEYQWLVEGYATPEYTARVYEGTWTSGSGSVRTEDAALYYTVKLRRTDGEACTGQTKGWSSDDISKNRVFVTRKTEASVEGLHTEDCSLAMGDPLFVNNKARFGCKLPQGTRQVYIRSGDEYYYEVVGYPDDGYSYAAHVYWTGWLSGGERTITLQDPQLYYVVTVRRVDGATCTEEDIAKHRVVAVFDSSYEEKSDPYALPAYYFEDSYIDRKVETIRELLMNTAAAGDAFFFITDEHWIYNAKQSPKLVRYIKNATGINKMFSGGDRGDDGYELEVSRVFREALGNDNYYPVVGNHDLSRWEYKSSSYAYASAFMHLADDAKVHGDGSGNAYYYVENTAQKIRCVVLQGYQPSATPDRYGAHLTIEYDAEQIEWFKNVALNVEEGWTILIFTHALIYGTDTPHDIYIPTEFASYMEVYDIIQNYSGKGTIAAVLQGHTHYDDSTAIPCAADPTRSIPVIISTADRYVADTSMVQGDRQFGTITEQAFDVVVLDKVARKLTLVRIGAPAQDHEGNKMEIREFYY